MSAPVMVPQGLSDFVGTTTARFDEENLGTIHYTLDGTTPNSRSEKYQEGREIQIDRSLTLKAIRISVGLSSEVVTGRFTRAKVPSPTAKFGGKMSFYPSVLCTLNVAKSGITPSIRYTLDGLAPGPASPLYTTPIQITKTSFLQAYATSTGYDDSEPIQTSFTLLDPVAAPSATPKSQTFSTGTLTVKLKTATSGAAIRSTLDTALKSLDNATLGDSVVLVGGKVGDTIHLRAQAFKTGLPSSAISSEKYVYFPPVATPVPSKPAGEFYDTGLVVLTAGKGDTIRYVTDNSVITTRSPIYTQPIAFATTTTLKAQAFHAPQPASAILSAYYPLNLSAPIFDKQSQEFQNSLEIGITSKSPAAIIYYTLNGADPTLLAGIALPPSEKVTISAESTTTLKAIAYLNGVSSGVATSVYTKKAAPLKLAAPSIDPATRNFEESILIQMDAGRAEAEVRFTTDGTDPSPTSRKYTAPIRLDSTAVLRARSFPLSGNMESSIVREEIYTLIPSQPTADPAGTGMAFPNSVLVTLSTRTKNGVIKYVLGKTPFDYGLATTYAVGHPIRIDSTTRLQAVTELTSGGITLYSNPLDVSFEVYKKSTSDTVAQGGARILSDGYAFTNASDLPILAVTHTTDVYGITGFKDAALAVTLLATQANQVFEVTFTKAADKNAALYRYVNGRVEFVSADSQVDSLPPGEYFVGTDTLPPTITLLNQEPAKGATLLKLSIKDNVANPSCEIQSPGALGGKIMVKPDPEGGVTVTLAASGADLSGLWFRAVSRDFNNTGRLPKDPAGKIYLSQIWDRLITPPVLSLGGPNSAWDMAGFPVEAGAPIRWKQLRADNEAANLDGAVWNGLLGTYAYLEDTSVIKPGMAFWLGSRTALSRVTVSGFRAAASETDGGFRMILRPGWNQVTSPSLETVYWPTTIAASKSQSVHLKAPYQYVPEKGDYTQCDTLSPWRGYFVHSFSRLDTVITVYSDASRRAAGQTALNPALKTTAETGKEEHRPVELKLDIGRTMPLGLAAQTQAQDGVGAEDEPDLPALNRNFAAWAQRGRRHLLTDVVHLTPGEPLHWNIVVAQSGSSGDGRTGSGMFRVAEIRMPAGYQAWAVSSARSMKFRLEAGVEIPLSGMAGDTLSVHAGPLEKLTAIAELAGAVASVDQFSFNLRSGENGKILQLALPWAAEVAVSVWSPAGRLLAAARPGRLNSGIYRLPLREYQMPSGRGAQIGFLRILANGESGRKEFSQKVIW